VKKSMFLSMVSSVAVLGSLMAAPAVQAEVSASAGVSNMYLWRGYDLGGGAAVSGDLSVSSQSGLYAGIWGSSGDEVLGNEYDVYAGWGGDVGPVSLDVSLWSYAYPESDISPGELVDAVISVGAGPVTGTLYEMIEGDDGNDYRYMTLGLEKGKYSGLLGHHSYEIGDDATHLDLSYAYNDNLSFTLSKFLNGEDDDDLKFVASYSLDIK
jgi:uncharacterized protein (TIGR02001 family)